ncbi:MAG: exodeoxyribonuclease VII small subunit [Erysipelotrichales bacterium]|nr:exodeoxyribonuclease VII small subunit [Erysipelotrichales bacterium]
MSNDVKLSYEEAVKRLETIVDTLEENRVPLDEAIKLFDEGLNLVQYCEKQLKSFEEKIDTVLKEHKMKEENNDEF